MTKENLESFIPYYQLQMAKLTNLSLVSVQFTDFEGHQTNHMNLNGEVLKEIIKLFVELEINKIMEVNKQ